MTNLARNVIRKVPASWLRFASENQWRVPQLRRVFVWGASLVKHQDTTILGGVGKGIKFNAANSHSAFILGYHEPVIQKLLADFLKPGKVYYDVGANVGFFSMIAARIVGDSGKVICFEPMPDNADRIDHNAKLNGFSNVLVRRECAGDENTTATFLTSHEPTWGRLSSVGKAPDKPSGETTVRVQRMDDARSADSLPPPDLMKIDVEGAEVAVLEGAIETLKKHRPLIAMELHGTNNAVLDVLEKIDYTAAAVGTTIPIREANFEIYIIAAPRERADLVDMMKRVATSAA